LFEIGHDGPPGESTPFFWRKIVNIWFMTGLPGAVRLAPCQVTREAERLRLSQFRGLPRTAPRLAAKKLLHAPVKDLFSGPTWKGPKDETDVPELISIKSQQALTRTAQHRPGVPLRAAKEPKKGGDGGPGTGTALITRTRQQTRRPNMYRVLLLNDDYTTQEFVVIVLRKYFNKSVEEATRIMLHVHNHGVGECGVYTYEVAETKVTQVMDFARKHQHPLQCIMEKK
jgi:ATP-dependent Clp protease adaptor protein ClpS